MNNEIGNKYHLADRLSIACDAMGICISAEQQRQLLAYLDQLLRWNKTYNLTAIRDPEQGTYLLICKAFISQDLICTQKYRSL
jgi:16S rRNA (guanine527-N7)-methyltransferase